MNLDTAYEIPVHVVARQVGEETVILDLESGTYYGLDPVGARIWELLGQGLTLGQLRGRMYQEYEVTSEVLERDLRKLVQDLSARKLVLARA